MEKLKSSFKNMLLSLALISIVVAGLLALVYGMTKEPISQAEKQKQEKAIKDVTPDFNNNPTDEKFEIEISGGDKLTVFPAKKDGKLVGIAVETNTKKGFSGEIKIMVGFDIDGVIKNYSVLKHAETPGLGAKMQEWFSDTSKPTQNVVNRKWNSNMKVKKDGGEIDAITAATISSRAFMDALNRAYEVYLKVNESDLQTQESPE
ncbi:MAG: RnfABCDGE type electron transport complex subunit G [Prevotellaceae bacterium]|jgi:electron transport complex protein RnfG|nr:RnfABCDGE type electron transport complex subunit G [Prevotellaceae bacterium]